MLAAIGQRFARPAVGIVCATLVATSLCATPSADAARKKRGAKPGISAVTLDLSSLETLGDSSLTIALPDDLWRAHLVRMLKYPKKNQLTEAEGPRVAERWLQSQEDDGRGYDAEIFVVVEPREGNSLREWARYVANESDSVFPFEDARFDGPWIINHRPVKIGGKQKVRGYILENSGGREGEKERFVWQFALLPIPADCQTMIGVKRRAPTTWGSGDPGGVPEGPVGGPGSGPDVGGDIGLGGDTGDGGGSLGDGVSGDGGLGGSSTEPNSNQVRASNELFRTLLEGIELKPSKKLTKGLRRFRMRDEWNGARNQLTSRFVGIDVPAAWRSTPTTALQGRDRIEWTEFTDDGAVAGIVRITFVSAKFDGEITTHATEKLADWDVEGAELEPFATRDGTTMAAVCETEITSDFGLRRGDSSDWVREVGFVMAPHTFYSVEALRPPEAKSNVKLLRAMLESIEIFVAQ